MSIKLTWSHVSSMALLLVFSIPDAVIASSTRAPRIALHVVAVTSKGQPLCNNPPSPPCNDGEGHFTVHGAIGAVPTRYYAYILVTDAWSVISGVTYGVGAATFGISYDNAALSGVDVRTWASCGDLSFPSSAWPASGSGIAVTWDAQNNCQGTPATGDLDGGISTVAAVLDIDVYSDDVLSITPRNDQSAHEFQITTCTGRTINLQFPDRAGKASFGSADAGYDPCKGRFVAFSEFTSLPTQELETVVVKLTPIGGERARSVFLKGPGAIADSAVFAAYHRVPFGYSTDDPWPGIPQREEVLTATQMGALLDSIAATPQAIDGNVDDPPALSVGIFKTSGGTTRGYEAILNREGGRGLLQRVREAVGVPAAVENLDILACAMGMVPQSGATDVTGLVSVKVGGFRMDHNANEFVSVVRVHNASAQSLQAPISLILNEGENIAVANPSGYVCRFPPGPTYFDLNVGSAFEPDETVEVTVRVRNTLPPKLDLSPLVVAGRGIR